jgi:hypothetical protein
MLGIAAALALILQELPDPSLFLLNERSGMSQPLQLLAVMGHWKNPNGTCRAGVTECQRQNRSARLFVAEPAGCLK